MFDPELKVKWLEALRSDKYQQGKSYLRTVDDKFCCLGVLCDVVDPKGWNKVPGGSWEYADRSGFLPTEVAIKTGLKSVPTGDAYFTEADTDSCQFKLSAMNDHGSSFAEIADWIEKTL